MLKDHEFIEVVNSEWKKYDDDKEDRAMFQFNGYLKRVKDIIIEWDKRKYKESHIHLSIFEEEISSVYSRNSTSIFSKEEKLIIKDLEATKKELLEWEESKWR